MKKIIRIAALAIIAVGILGSSLFAAGKKVDVNTKLTQEEQDAGNDVIAKFNAFINDPSHSMLKIEEAIKSKDRFSKMLYNKRETIAGRNAFKLMNQLPVRKQFCVTAMLTKNLPKIDQCVKELDLMDKEVDNQYAKTRKEVIYENLVIHYGNALDYEQAEKLAYRTLSIYPDNIDTLKNMATLYAKSLRNRFKDEIEAGCYAVYLENRAKKLQGKKTTDFAECNGFDGNLKFNQISQIVLNGVSLQKNKIGFNK